MFGMCCVFETRPLGSRVATLGMWGQMTEDVRSDEALGFDVCELGKGVT